MEQPNKYLERHLDKLESTLPSALSMRQISDLNWGSPTSLYKIIKNSYLKIPLHKLGRQYFVKKSDLVEGIRKSYRRHNES